MRRRRRRLPASRRMQFMLQLQRKRQRRRRGPWEAVVAARVPLPPGLRHKSKPPPHPPPPRGARPTSSRRMPPRSASSRRPAGCQSTNPCMFNNSSRACTRTWRAWYSHVASSRPSASSQRYDSRAVRRAAGCDDADDATTRFAPCGCVAVSHRMSVLPSATKLVRGMITSGGSVRSAPYGRISS